MTRITFGKQLSFSDRLNCLYIYTQATVAFSDLSLSLFTNSRCLVPLLVASTTAHSLFLLLRPASYHGSCEKFLDSNGRITHAACNWQHKVPPRIPAIWAIGLTYPMVYVQPRSTLAQATKCWPSD